MNTITWKVTARPETGKGAARKTRAAGLIPIVAYGKELPSRPLSVDAKTLEEFFRQPNWQQLLITLEAEGATDLKDKFFMIRDIQRHHILYHPIALDLLSIRLDQKIKLEVPLEVHGGAEVKKLGGILEILHRTLPIRCLPTNIPAKIVVDAGHLLLNQTLHLADVTLPEGVETDLPQDYPLCTALTVRIEEEAPKPVEGAEVAPVEGEEEKKEEAEEKEE
jgi:large subunit ribosomal protein L25